MVRPPEDRTKFLEALRLYGQPHAAATASGIPIETAYSWRTRDPDYAKEWDAAKAYAKGHPRMLLVGKANAGSLPAIQQWDRVENPDDYQTSVRHMHEGTVYFSHIPRAPSLDELPDAPALEAVYREVAE
jgi:hypothetical protein